MGESRAARASLRRVVVTASYYLVAAVGLIYRLLFRGHQCAHPPRTILVVRLDLLGDVLFSRQAALSLRAAFPNARIVLLTLPYTAPLARLYPEVDDVIEVDTNRIRSVRGLLNPSTWTAYYRAAQALRSLRPDRTVSLSGRMASLWAFLSGAPCVVGYADEAFPFMLTHKVPGGRYLERKHEVEYVRRLAEAAGGAPVGQGLSVDVPESTMAEVDRLLADRGISPDDRVVVVHAGSINGSAKRWPAPQWASFSDALQSQAHVKTVLVGSESDSAIATQVLERATVAPISLVGTTSVDQLIAVLSRADLVATGDSGPLHLAVALGRPLLGVYGPTDPCIHGPFQPRAPVAVHRRDLPCSPCYTMTASAECPLGDPICMRLVSVEDMVASAVQLLQGSTKTA